MKRYMIKGFTYTNCLGYLKSEFMDAPDCDIAWVVSWENAADDATKFDLETAIERKEMLEPQGIQCLIMEV